MQPSGSSILSFAILTVALLALACGGPTGPRDQPLVVRLTVSPPTIQAIPGAEGWSANWTVNVDAATEFPPDSHGVLLPFSSEPVFMDSVQSNIISADGRPGVLVFDVASGDRDGLRRWLKVQEKEHGGDAWFRRVEQAIAEGSWDHAFQAAAAASHAAYREAYLAAKTPGQRAAMEAATRGTPPPQQDGTEALGAVMHRSPGYSESAPIGVAPARMATSPPDDLDAVRTNLSPRMGRVALAVAWFVGVSVVALFALFVWPTA